MKRLSALTSLRIFAAAAVLAVHFLTPFTSSWPKVARSLVLNGGYGVPVFFVLSGFILTLSYADPARLDAVSAGKFYVARIARIYPLYLLAFLVPIPIVLASIHAGKYSSNDFVVQMIVRPLLLQSWSTSLTVHDWNSADWTLSVEAFFYLLFPLLIRPLKRLTPPFASLLCLASLAMVFAVRFAIVWVSPLNYSDHDVTTWNDHTRLLTQLPLLRLPEFLLGACAACMVRPAGTAREPERRKSALWAAIWLVVAAEMLVLGQVVPLWEPLTFTVGVAGAAALIALQSLVRDAEAGILASKGLVLLGEASYAIYILQAPVYAYFEVMAKRLGIMGISTNLPLTSVFLATLIGLSILLHVKFELPLRARIRGASPRPSTLLGS